MQRILWLLMAFAGALPAVLAVSALLYCLGQRRDIRKKLGMMSAFEPTASRKEPTVSKESASFAGEAYLRERVDPAIGSYHSKATACSVSFTCLTVLQITWSAMIAVALLLTEEPGEPSYTKAFSAVLSAAVATVSGVNAACKFRERWLQYLDLRDKLFAERSMFLCAGVYQGLWRRGKDGARHNLVEKCEGIIALECRNLSDNLNKPEEAGHGGKAQAEGNAEG